jgi:nucleotide-binding universal stress UspA family protein
MSWVPRNKIVVPIDFSDSSADAIRTALELVSAPAAVHVVHVLLPIDYLSPGVVFGTVTDDTREANANRYLEEYLQKHGFTGVTAVLRIGDPGLEVTEYARTEKADLIVIPSHGYHGAKRFVLGSVAERVIRHADCAVLVLRRRDAE